MQANDCYELGFISKAHGIRGEVKVVFDVNDIYEYTELESVYLLQKGKLIPFFVDAIRIQGESNALIQFRNTYDRDQAEALKGCKLLLPLDLLPETDENGFYYHEVIGYKIHDKELGELGTISDVMEMPGQDLIAMQYKNQEVLIPISDEVVLFPDHENKIMHTQLPEGLLEVYLS